MPRMNTHPTLLGHVFDHEAQQPERIFLTQPLGQGRVADYTWRQVLDQSRRMAAHLQSLGLPRGARIAILSKNCAHFVMAELAIWLGGYTTVAIFPTETADTVGYVLGHSEASLLFVGKQTPVDKIGRHTVLAPKIEIPNRCLQRGGDYLRLSLGHSQQHGEGHILQVIAIGHLGSTAYRFFTLTGFGDQQTLPDILIVIATPHHMKITQQRLPRGRLTRPRLPFLTQTKCQHSLCLPGH